MSGLEKALFNLKVCFFFRRERGGEEREERERERWERDTDLMELRNSLQRNNSIDKLRKPAKMRRQRRINSKRFALPPPHPLPKTKKTKNKKTDEQQAIQQGHTDIARIYAQNCIRKSNERLNLLRLGSRIDAVASRVQTAVTMRQVTGSMANVVRGMDQAMKAMDLEKISAVMDRFETQFEDLDVAAGYYENATAEATAVGTPQDDVDRLMNQVADEAGVELRNEMEGVKVDNAAVKVKSGGPGVSEVEEDGLGERLRALRS
jgi:charged multivesicular body protein 1